MAFVYIHSRRKFEIYFFLFLSCAMFYFLPFNIGTLVILIRQKILIHTKFKKVFSYNFEIYKHTNIQKIQQINKKVFSYSFEIYKHTNIQKIQQINLKFNYIQITIYMFFELLIISSLSLIYVFFSFFDTRANKKLRCI